MEVKLAGPPGDFWASFRRAHGDEAILKAYRLPYGIDWFPRPGEKVWGGYVEGTLAGWGSLTVEGFGTSRLLVIGVFPAFERQGVRNKLAAALLDMAFEDPYVLRVTTAVLATNMKMVERLQREARTYRLWREAGLMWYPPPSYWVYVMPREHWVNRKPILEGVVPSKHDP